MISKSEWQEICMALLDHHSLFYKIGEMGRPILTDSIPTACVTFDKSGKYINFLFNPDFWASCDFYKKIFVVAHEALHIILNHGKRFKDSQNPQTSNVAIDIVVNHSLTNRFGFVRERIDGHEELCWVDTIFKDKKINGQEISQDESAEYYLNMINRNQKKTNIQFVKLIDNHNFEDTSDEVFDNLNRELSDDEKKSLKNFCEKHSNDKEAGTSSGSGIHFATKDKVQVKKPWESVIQKWAKRRLVNMDADVEQWAKKHRRFTGLEADLFLPSDSEIEDLTFDKRKIVVHFYLDTSGSCWHLKDRFFSAAESLPKKYFDIRLFCFDTVVFETSLETRKLQGGGGTRFDIIEDNIQKVIREENTNYPDATFVITDLYGNKVNPQKPETWFWFVDGGLDSTIKKLASEYIHKDSKVYKLNDFV
jgi:predicted metal-dependent peptidase